ncbi:MAG: hypothetical protein R6W71_12330, partial [Bacteroidales bacterium]
LNLLKEPLLHFLLIGAGLFLLYGWEQDAWNNTFLVIIKIRSSLQKLMTGYYLCRLNVLLMHRPGK